MTCSVVSFTGRACRCAVAFIGPLISLIIGGWVDNTMMRVVEVLYAFPALLSIVLLMAFFRTTLAQPEERLLTIMVSSTRSSADYYSL